MKQRILVVSSSNMDLVVNTPRMPQAGESAVVVDNVYDYVPGGKGANAALTFARLGADSVFCARLGDDTNGNMLKNFYDENKIDTRFISFDKEEKTGLAVIIVEGNGNNRIIVYPGANFSLSSSDVEEAFTCYPDALFLQLEIPSETVVKATRFAKVQNIPVFIDAGPAYKDFPLEELENVEIFSPNEVETQILTGIYPTTPEICMKACTVLLSKVKAKHIVLKLGARGAFLYDGRYYKMLAPYDVDVVDTTAAGDAFSAAMTLEYINSKDIKRACTYANIIGSMTVSKAGASTSIPTAEEVRKFMYDNSIKLP